MAYLSEREREIRRLCTSTGRVKHRKRDEIHAGLAAHVTLKVGRHVPSLRRRRVLAELEGCFRAAKNRFGFRLLQYSVMSNHLHLIVEADDRRALSRGMQGLGIRLAKAIQRLFGLRGQVFRDRYFARVLRTVQAAFKALRYVLQNARKHGVRLPPGEYDPYSSARFCQQCDGKPWTHPRLPVHWPNLGMYHSMGHPVGPDHVPGLAPA